MGLSKIAGVTLRLEKKAIRSSLRLLGYEICTSGVPFPALLHSHKGILIFLGSRTAYEHIRCILEVL